MKPQFPREFYIPKTYTMIVRAKNADAVVYMSIDGKPGAVAFRGKAQKPTFHYTYRTEERRAQHVAEFFASCESIEKQRSDRKAARKAFRHTLQVGAVLRCSWGYDQTNIDFFEVVALVGHAMVEIRAIAQESEDTGFMCGQCVPVPGKYIGKAMRKRVTEGNAVAIHSFAHAYPVEMREVAPGVKVTGASYWSSYA